MSKSYALTNIDSRIKKDGSVAFITLDLSQYPEGKPTFFADLQGISKLITMLNEVSIEMTARLIKSDKADPYHNPARPLQVEKIIDSSVGLTLDGKAVVVSANTEEGRLNDMLFPVELFQEIVDKSASLLQKNKDQAEQ